MKASRSFRAATRPTSWWYFSGATPRAMASLASPTSSSMRLRIALFCMLRVLRRLLHPRLHHLAGFAQNRAGQIGSLFGGAQLLVVGSNALLHFDGER